MNGRTRGMPPRRLSRETRHLLLAALVAVAALWMLARIRFPDRPATPNPIPPLLTQLSSRPAFAELEAELGRAQTRLAPFLVAWRPAPPGGAGHVGPSPARPALRIRADAALAFVPRGALAGTALPPDVLGVDRATGLTAVRTSTAGAAATPPLWTPESLETGRFFTAAFAAGDRISLRPLFVPALTPRRTAAWSGPVWTLAGIDAPPEGSLLFTGNGEFVGALVDVGPDRAIVPADVLLGDAQRLLDRGRTIPGNLGIDAQPLTPAVAAATRTPSGVVVTFVAPDSEAAPFLRAGDVIVALDGVALDTWEQWDVRANRYAAGDTVVLHVRSNGEPRRVEILARPDAGEDRALSARLGLLLRNVAATGSEVLVVEPGSAAAAAGLRHGDVITRFGDAEAPAPAEVRRAYAEAEPSRALVVAVTRDGTHRVLAIQK